MCRRPSSLVRSSGKVDSVITSMVYARRVFDLDVLPSSHRLHSFLQTALKFAGEDELFQALSKELLKTASFLPRAILHENQQTFSATSFCVLSSATFGYLKSQSRRRLLREDECAPLLKAIQVTLLAEFQVDLTKSRDITR